MVNIANIVTVSRVGLALIAIYMLSLPGEAIRWAAFWLTAFVIYADALDGYLARKLKQASKFVKKTIRDFWKSLQSTADAGQRLQNADGTTCDICQVPWSWVETFGKANPSKDFSWEKLPESLSSRWTCEFCTNFHLCPICLGPSSNNAVIHTKICKLKYPTGFNLF